MPLETFLTRLPPSSNANPTGAGSPARRLLPFIGFFDVVCEKTSGGACLYLFVGPVTIYPTLFGRLTGIVMTGLVAFLLVLHTVGGHLRERLESLTVTALGVLLAATVIQVIALGWYNLRVMTGANAATRGRVVGDVRWGAQ